MEDDMYFENDEQGMPKTVRRRKKQLYAAIRERMEFYFSDANLQKDRFLSQLIGKNPEVDLEVFLKFNRILQLTDNTRDLVKALKKSEMLQLTEDKTKVFRTTPIREKTNLDECTIYVEQLSCDADHDWLKDVFSKFGKVDYISIPKYKSSGKIKGFAFVEFDTPESAQKALKEFEKAGCCLTNQMNPEQLCSIATYEDDKGENKNQYEVNSKVKVNNGDAENEKAKPKKRKSEVDNSSADESAPKEKKVKKSESEENGENNNCDDDEKNNSEVDMSEEEEKTKDGGEESAGLKKKKNRKKKKSHKIKYVRDIQSYGLQILSKADWKRLRNKYLNIQKEKMKKLKQHLLRNQMYHPRQPHQQQPQQQQQQQQQTNVENQSKPRFEFKAGVVIKVVLDEPLDDANQVTKFKCHAKSLDNVEYVDVTQGTGEAYIRFRDEDTVREVMQTKPWENIHVLEGDEEREYWEKMKRDRTEKFENRKKFSNKRGRNKLINKVEKVISKRIRLSVDE